MVPKTYTKHPILLSKHSTREGLSTTTANERQKDSKWMEAKA